MHEILTRVFIRPIAAKENDADGLIRCDDEESVRARFFNDLKEAVCVARGSAAAVMSMTRAAQADLWRSVVDGERRLAWRAEEALGSRRGGAESSSGGGSGKRSDARRRCPERRPFAKIICWVITYREPLRSTRRKEGPTKNSPGTR